MSIEWQKKGTRKWVSADGRWVCRRDRESDTPKWIGSDTQTGDTSASLDLAAAKLWCEQRQGGQTTQATTKPAAKRPAKVPPPARPDTHQADNPPAPTLTEVGALGLRVADLTAEVSRLATELQTRREELTDLLADLGTALG